MRLPFTPLHHAFPEFESLSREECDRYVRYVHTTRPVLVRLFPLLLGIVVLIAVPVLVALSRRMGWLWPDAPVHWHLLLAAAGSLAGFFAVWLLLRDLLLWWFVRAQVLRARCPRCKHSLQGLPIIEIGDGLDPTLRFVRCTECGRKHRLFDLGITPQDLVPFEQRAVPPDFGQVRRSSFNRQGSD